MGSGRPKRWEESTFQRHCWSKERMFQGWESYWNKSLVPYLAPMRATSAPGWSAPRTWQRQSIQHKNARWFTTRSGIIVFYATTLNTVVEDSLEGRLIISTASAAGCRHVNAQIPPGQRDSRPIAVTVGLGHRQESHLSKEDGVCKSWRALYNDGEHLFSLLIAVLIMEQTPNAGRKFRWRKFTRRRARRRSDGFHRATKLNSLTWASRRPSVFETRKSVHAANEDPQVASLTVRMT